MSFVLLGGQGVKRQKYIGKNSSTAREELTKKMSESQTKAGNQRKFENLKIFENFKKF